MKYMNSLENVVISIQNNIETVKLNSMTQRTLLVDIYGYYCDALFYFALEPCDKKVLKQLSGSYNDYINNLLNIKWQDITSVDTYPYPNKPETFSGYHVDIKDNGTFQPIKQLKDHRYCSD